MIQLLYVKFIILIIFIKFVKIIIRGCMLDSQFQIYYSETYVKFEEQIQYKKNQSKSFVTNIDISNLKNLQQFFSDFFMTQQLGGSFTQGELTTIKKKLSEREAVIVHHTTGVSGWVHSLFPTKQAELLYQKGCIELLKEKVEEAMKEAPVSPVDYSEDHFISGACDEFFTIGTDSSEETSFKDEEDGTVLKSKTTEPDHHQTIVGTMLKYFHASTNKKSEG